MGVGCGHQEAVSVSGERAVRHGLIASAHRFEKRIYIPLPDPAARVKMFHLNIGTTPCQLSQADYRALADKTDGYSGSDLAVVVRDALMQPVRKVLSATHFKEVRPRSRLLHRSARSWPQAADVDFASGAQVEVPVEDSDPPATVKKLTPCSPGDPGAREMTWNDVNSDQLQEPPLCVLSSLKLAAAAPHSRHTRRLQEN